MQTQIPNERKKLFQAFFGVVWTEGIEGQALALDALLIQLAGCQGNGMAPGLEGVHHRQQGMDMTHARLGDKQDALG